MDYNQDEVIRFDQDHEVINLRDDTTENETVRKLFAPASKEDHTELEIVKASVYIAHVYVNESLLATNNIINSMYTYLTRLFGDVTETSVNGEMLGLIGIKDKCILIASEVVYMDQLENEIIVKLEKIN